MAKGSARRTYARDARGRFASTNSSGRPKVTRGTLKARASLGKSRAKLAAKDPADRSVKGTLSRRSQKGAVTRGKKVLAQAKKEARVRLRVGLPKGVIRKSKGKGRKAPPAVPPAVIVRQAPKRIKLPGAGLLPKSTIRKPKGYRRGDIGRRIKLAEAKKAAVRAARASAPTSANYTKLRNGNWGVRVNGNVAKGQVVEVVTRAGARKTETVDRQLWSGDGVSIWTLRPSQRPPTGGGGWRSREITLDTHSRSTVEAHYRRLGWDGVYGSTSYYTSGMYDEES